MKKILIIDDSKTQLISLKIFFAKNNFDVETAENGIDGYKQVVENPPDAIICDVMMPNLNGYQFARLLKNNPLTQKIPIILLTSLNQNIDRFWGKQAGADLFLSKNCELEELIENTKNIIEKFPVAEGIKKTIANTHALRNALQVKINDVLDRSLMEATIMNEFRKLAKNIENSSEFLISFFKLISSIFNYDLCTIHFFEDNTASVSKIYYSSEYHEFNKDVLTRFLEHCFQVNSLVISDVVTSDMARSETKNTNFLTKFVMDLSVNDKKLAQLGLFSYENIDYKSFQFFEVVQNELALLAQIRNLYAQTKLLSITDGLTSLYNRRYLYENIEREFDRVKRYKSNLSVAMLDIDFFKSINDTYGHQCGDEVLKVLAQTLINKLRKTDLIFRYGGEEFCVLLPETNIQNAFIPLERLRKFIEESTVNFDGKDVKFTISIGVSDINQNVESYDELIANADASLYKAKNNGRNKVILYEE